MGHLYVWCMSDMNSAATCTAISSCSNLCQSMLAPIPPDMQQCTLVVFFFDFHELAPTACIHGGSPLYAIRCWHHLPYLQQCSLLVLLLPWTSANTVLALVVVAHCNFCWWSISQQHWCIFYIILQLALCGGNITTKDGKNYKILWFKFLLMTV